MTPVFNINTFHFGAASVLPTYKNQHGQTMVILGREAGGNDKGIYDDFGGRREKQECPLITAARECWEELILGETWPISLNDFRNYIDLTSGNTYFIIATASKNAQSVLYITDVSNSWNTIRKKFYTARAHAKQKRYREKDHLAVVSWSDLEKAIVSSKHGQPVTVSAYGINQHGEYDAQPITISLRRWLISKLRPFFQNKPFQEGQSPQIRFYQQ